MPKKPFLKINLLIVILLAKASYASFSADLELSVQSGYPSMLRFGINGIYKNVFGIGASAGFNYAIEADILNYLMGGFKFSENNYLRFGYGFHYIPRTKSQMADDHMGVFALISYKRDLLRKNRSVVVNISYDIGNYDEEYSSRFLGVYVGYCFIVSNVF